ncbi:MAG: CoA-binding protein, partial [Candidatus Eisenbacteria bacterium]
QEEDLKAIVRAARVVAVLGMKDEARPHEPAIRIPLMLVAHGMEVIPVNPTIAASLGRRSWETLAEVPVAFDLVDVFRRSDRIPAIAEEILALPAERRPMVVWLQSGIRHDAAAARLEKAGITVVQDECLGVLAARWREPAPGPGL